MQPLLDEDTKQFGVEPVSAVEPITTADRWIGRRVGNYIVDRPLARGGMGTVYVARHPQLGREVAVKFLSHEVSAEPEIAARFLAEARVTASLNHPNIVEILDFGELDGELYYAMELLRGKSLRAVMREKGRLSSAACRPYVEQICWALEAAHRAGIVHRDLKPANVLVLEGEPLRLKLLDFGIAKLMSSSHSQTRAGQVLGTATHMAPEQALGDPGRVTPKSDLYSLGAIAYEMVTGAPVFHHESDMMLMIMHVRDAVKPVREHVSDVPLSVARLIEACLAKNPADRPASARLIADELARALSEAEPAAPAAARSPLPPAKELPLGEQPTRFPSQAPAAELTRRAAAPPVALAPAAAPAAAARPAPPPAAPAGSATLVSPPAPLAEKAPHRPAAAPVRAHGAAGSPATPSAAVSAEALAESTLGTLLSRLQRKGDFPAFARAIGEVSKKADANGSFSAGQLGDSILKDYALTARLLRIVNATYARRFGGKIYSVQHAIVILGFDRVRSLALSISLFKAASAGNDSARVSESAISALISSELARNLARKARVGDDEATVCAMFKNLGRHLALVHLPELYDRVTALVDEDGLGVNAAAKRILGMTFEELGTAVAKSWQLPQQIVGAMSATDLPQGPLERSADRLNALAAFSTELCDVVTREGPETRERAVRDLLVKHKNLIALDPEALAAILAEVEGSLNERYASLLGSALKSSRFVANATPPAAGSRAGAAVELPPLAERIQAVRDALEQGQASDAVLTLALRIVADHLGTPEPLVLTAASNKEHLVVRFGLRDDLAGLKRELKFPLRAASARNQPFAACFHAGKDLLVKDCFAKENAETFPPSYFEVLGSPALALYACLGKALSPALLVLEADMPEALPDPARVAELAELRPLIARAAAR